MITIENYIELEQITNEKKIIVYGAGRVGLALLTYLNEKKIAEERVLVVVSKKNKNEDTMCGYRIFECDDQCLNWKDSCIIIAMMENGARQVEKIVYEKAKEYFTLSEQLCLDLRHKIGDFEYEISTLTNEKNNLASKVNELQAKITRLTPQKKLSYLVVNILDHCNLNCKGCDHFASIAKERFVDKDIVIKDLYRLSKIMKSGIERIGIMGGEPLLHPDLIDIVYEARKAFPKSHIQIDTNGILLEKQLDDFWNCVRDNNIEILQTKYPINLEFNKIENLCREKQVTHSYYGNTRDVLKTSYKIPFDIKGEQDVNESFSNCFHANNCVTLLEGKIYPCTVAPNAHIFNERYHDNLNVTEEDYIDIYSNNITEKKILDFISTPIPFCRFCDVKNRSFLHEWSIGKGEKTEWMLTEREKMPYHEDRIRRPRERLKFEVHLTEHCNLNCKGCYHFSPIADREFLNVDKYSEAIQRLSFLYDGKMEKIILLGGEPLLHPDIKKIMDITRASFREGIISIVTNGILLSKMCSDFWECCRRNSVLIEPTKYPLNINYSEIENTAASYGVKMNFFNSGEVEKTLTRQTIDVRGKQPKEGNFYGCYRANECITLKDNRLYTCIIPAHIHHLNKKFDLNLPNFESDGIDIFLNGKEEIMKFLTRPIDACRYCDRANMQSGIPWETSMFDKSEWID